MTDAREVEPGDRIFDGEMTHPKGCPRGRDDCEPLARVASLGYESFMCCGENTPKSRQVVEDRFRLCIKSTHDQGPVDVLVNMDERDVTDTASVLIGGLSTDAQRKAAEALRPPTEPPGGSE